MAVDELQWWSFLNRVPRLEKPEWLKKVLLLALPCRQGPEVAVAVAPSRAPRCSTAPSRPTGKEGGERRDAPDPVSAKRQSALRAVLRRRAGSRELARGGGGGGVRAPPGP